LRDLKLTRKSGDCPVTELRIQKREEAERLSRRNDKFTVKDLIELYLKQCIEDRVVNDRHIKGARKRKGQVEVRRTLYHDVVRVLGGRITADVTRKDVVTLILNIVERGSNVQASSVLREFTAAYEYA